MVPAPGVSSLPACKVAHHVEVGAGLGGGLQLDEVGVASHGHGAARHTDILVVRAPNRLVDVDAFFEGQTGIGDNSNSSGRDKVSPQENTMATIGNNNVFAIPTNINLIILHRDLN